MASFFSDLRYHFWFSGIITNDMPCPSYYNITLDGIEVFSAQSWGYSICMDELVSIIDVFFEVLVYAVELYFVWHYWNIYF